MRFFPFLAFLACSTLASAGAIIGQWEGDGRALDAAGGGVISWNWAPTSTSYSTNMIRSLVTGAGATVTPDSPINVANLATWDVLVIRFPATAPTASELGLLSTWVANGGLLLMIGDSSANTSAFNATLAGVGSTMTAGGSIDQNVYFVAGLFLTDGPPYSIVGNWATFTPGIGISGGTSLTRGGASWTARQQADAAAYIHYEQIGLGYVVAFADSLDANYVLESNGVALDRLFLNLTAYSNPHGAAAPANDPPPVTSEAPEPSTLVLIAGGVAATVALRRRR